MATAEKLLYKQSQLMQSISKSLSNFKKLGHAKMTEAVTRNRISQLEGLFAMVQDLDADLHCAIDEASRSKYPYFVDQHFSKCEIILTETLDFMHEVLAGLQPGPSVSPSAKSEVKFAPRSVSHLPRLELPTFDGSFLKWETFRDRFQSMIIDDASLSDVERMHYLCSILTGDASNAVSHLPVTAANFKVAWEIVSSRYENKRRLISTHLNSLFSLPPVTGESAKNLQALRDQTNMAVMALKNLGRPVEHWDDILVYLVAQKLDKSARKAWELKLGDTVEFPAYAELDTFLVSRIRALDAILPGKPGAGSESTGAKSSKTKNISSHAATAGKFSCPVCKTNHLLFQCMTFLSYTPDKRHEFIKSQKRCFNCLAATHLTKECKNERRCKECSAKHHTLLHLTAKTKSPCDEPAVSSAQTKAESDTATTTNEIASHIISKIEAPTVDVLLATARVRVTSSQGRFARIRALLDQGSAATLISENLAQRLRLQRIKHNICVTGIGEVRSFSRYAACVSVSPDSKGDPVYVTTAIILPSLTKYTPSRAAVRPNWEHIANLPLADSDPFNSDSIDIIIGADLYGQLILDGIRKGRNDEPIAQNTTLGWILSGRMSSSLSVSSVHAHHGVLFENLDADIRRFWETEEIPHQTFLSPEEKQCEEHFVATHSRTSDGRYVVRLPFKAGPPDNLGDSRSIALSNLNRLERRLQRDQPKAKAYSDFLQEYESLGHMTKAKETPTGCLPYYIPHHAVFRETSSTTRLRVVFNASSRTTTGKSLNDFLLVGPKLQVDLASIILQWRQFRYVLTADIAKMYRQIRIDNRDVDYQRILWRSAPSSPVTEYHLRTVTYGTASAPFLALRVLRQLATDDGSRYPLALPVLNRLTYVDDCIFGADDLILARQTRDQLIALLARGGFPLRKWASNTSQLLVDIDPSDHGLACGKELQSDDSLTILGLLWHPERDVFHFRVSPSNHTGITKRAILSTIARLFDPLGWVTPVIITAKILMQGLWSLQCDWDEPVPPSVRTEWANFHSHLPALEQLAIPRWTEFGATTLQSELHGFADASTKAYAAAVYLRVTSLDSSTSVHLLVAKSKVAPLKPLSIPRLELCAALLLSRLLEFTRSALQLPSIPCHCWTDSTIVLAWLNHPPSRWKTFVANRVAKIQGLGPSVTWRHVPTADNPADCASRGLLPRELIAHPLWWSGPGWLRSVSEDWPQSSFNPEGDAREERLTRPVNLVYPAPRWDLQSRFSSWTKLQRVTAFIIRFISRLKQKVARREEASSQSAPPNFAALSTAELHSAKLFWTKTMQAEMFPLEMSNLSRSRSVPRTSPLAPLNPYLDPDGLLRVRGRLEKTNLPDAARHPIIIKSHPLVTLLIRDAHARSLHAGSQLTLTRLRQEYWILRARATIRAVLYKCVTCARERANVPTQLMGDLPKFRVTRVSRAFTHTGVDYAGPLSVRSLPGRGHKSHKAYIALFICMTTKAVHLELVSDYSSISFIAAYHRFTSRRGIPTSLYSDNGTTFQGADKELAASYRNATRNPDFANQIATEGVSWHFMPPAAPHFGGLWEAAVKSVKYHLKRCIGTHMLTFEEMTTLLCRIEACLNSRPIAAVSENLDDYRALTPGHFLIGAALSASPEPSALELPENRLSRWQLVQRMSEDFWRTWSHDYLHSLQQRPKWREIRSLAKPGQLVLVKDPNAPPSRWLLGRIIAIHPGDDGLIRVVTVKTANSEYKRPITKICFLPVEINREAESALSTAGGT